MRSPIPLLLATCGLLAAGLVAWRGERRGPDGAEAEGGSSAAAAPRPARETPQPAKTLAADPGAPLARLFAVPEIPLDRDVVAALFDQAKSASVALPLPGSLRARILLKHARGNGDLALGLRFEDDRETTAFLFRSSSGTFTGHLSSRRSASAFRLVADAVDGPLRLRRIAADELVCARFEEGRLQPGLPPDPESAEEEGGDAAAPEEAVPLLESRPASSRVIYLNFEGETVVGTPWNLSYNDGDPIVAAPFGTPAHIPGIWASIAEDYATFDVNVTTERADFDNAASGDRVMAIFTPTKSWYGSAGGVAYVDTFGSASNPYAWVFNLTLNGAAESGAHEIGHTLGLRHDGTSSRAYYSGHTHASGVSWAPIMGTGYGRSIVQFSKGEYPNANRSENDLAVVAGYLPPLPDDHGDSTATATEPVPSGPGEVAASGLVGNALDRDLFRIVTGGAGTITATASPHASHRNLDIGLELLDASLVPLQDAAPAGPFDATVAVPGLPAGTYYLRVRGTGLGDLATGYGAYGSIGAYRLEAAYPPSPLPEPPANLAAADGISTAHVALAWSPSALALGYRVYRGLSPEGGDAVLLASPPGTSYDDATAVPGTTYQYFVAAFNASGDSPLSPGESGWRQLLPPEPPASVAAGDDSPHSIRVSWPAGERAQSYRVSRHTTTAFAASTLLGTTTSLSWHDTTTAPDEGFHYFVESVNSGGSSAPVATPAPGVKKPLPPGTPSGLSASDGASSTQTLVSWNAAAGATGYRVYRNTVESAAGAAEIGAPGDATMFADTGGTPGTVYWYFVRAILAGGDSEPSNLESGYRFAAPPAAPGAVTATRGGHSGGVLVSWSASADAAAYLVFRGGEADPSGSDLLGRTTSPEWLDDTAAPGRSYRYFVRAENGSGLSGFSASALGFGDETDPADDAFENNDDVTEASPLPPGSIAAVAVDGDPDWYGVTLDPGEARLDLALSYEPARGSVLLALCDEDGLPVASAASGVSSRFLSHTGAAGASYRVLVERDEGAAVPYRLRLASLAPGEQGILPDAAIGTSLPPRIGEFVRNGDGSGQTLRTVQRGPGSRRVYSALTNRSAVAGSFLTRGRGGSRAFDVAYHVLRGGSRTAATGAVAGRGLRFPLGPFDTRIVSISVRTKGHPPGGHPPRGNPPRRRFRNTLFPLVSRVEGDRNASDRVLWHLVRLRACRR